jgi:nucleotide-binding universal stress UspA family protein
MTKKILCAVDETEFSKTAVAVAAQLGKALGAELTLLAVNQLSGGYGRVGISTYLWDEATLASVLAGATEAARQAGVSAPKTASVKSRDVGRAVVVYAEDNDIDHIVVGTGGKGGFSQLMLGSVSHDVLHRAHCTVTVARRHK